MIKYKHINRFGITGIVEVEGRLFVCKDKNGKDVFAGDSVKSGKRILTIVWNEHKMRWDADEEDGRYCLPLNHWAISEQFELIEDKEDEQSNGND